MHPPSHLTLVSPACNLPRISCAQLRGREVKYREYLRVGKGRDMGFGAILGFVSKVCNLPPSIPFHTLRPDLPPSMPFAALC